MTTNTPHYARILVCDDEAHIRQIIGRKLSMAGFHVVEARNGQEGLSLIGGGGAGAVFVPHLVITDLQMPMITGLEMCQVLKRRVETAHVPALMLTARGYILSPQDLAATNIRQVISKPFGVRQLLDRVVAVLCEQSRELVPPALLAGGDAAVPGLAA